MGKRGTKKISLGLVFVQVQGMSFLAAVFLLYVSPSEAFVCLAGILNRPCHLAFFRVDEKKVEENVGLKRKVFLTRLSHRCRRTLVYLRRFLKSICLSFRPTLSH